jgi:glycosyltransferase involved in cell wall biosynthesis
VATDVGGNAQAIFDGFNGNLVEPRSPKKLADAVVGLLRRKDLREKYIRNGLQVFRDRFSADIMTKRYEKLYLRKG